MSKKDKNKILLNAASQKGEPPVNPIEGEIKENNEEQKLPEIDGSMIKKEGEDSIDEDEEEENEAIGKIFDLPPEDIHESSKVVLQRQFYESIVRAASVKYANTSEYATLADKLKVLFKQKLVPNAGKNKAKSPDEEKQFRNSEKVFEEFKDPLTAIFKHFSRKTSSFGFEDVTLEVDDLINMFKKTGMLDGKIISLEDLINGVERFYAAEHSLKAKLTDEKFNQYLEQPAGAKLKEAAFKKIGEPEEEETKDQKEQRRKKQEKELEAIRKKWKQQVVSEHLVFVRGVEVCYFEFKELLLTIS